MHPPRCKAALLALLIAAFPALGQEDAADRARGGRVELDVPGVSYQDAVTRSYELFATARSYESLGQLEDAYGYYRDAYRANPQHYRAIYRAGRILRDMGRLEDAMAAFRRCIAIEQDFYPAYNNLGLLLIREGRTQEALEVLERGARSAPDYAPAWRNLGRARAEQSLHRPAAKAYERALELDPDHPASRVTLGLLQAHLGEYDRAREQLQQARALEPGNRRAALGLAWLDRQESAARQGESGAGGAPAEPLAPPERELPEEPDKRVQPRRAPTMPPPGGLWAFSAPEAVLKDPHEMLRQGVQDLRRGYYGRAVERLREAVRYGGRNEELFASLGHAHFLHGDFLAAAEAYARADERAWEPEPWYPLNRAIALKHAGVLDEAVDAAKEAIKREKNSAHARYVYGLLRLERGDLRRAESALEKSIELDGDYTEAHIALAVAHVRQDDPMKAIRAYRRALELRPDDPEVLLSYARLLEHQAYDYQAAEAYTDFVSLTKDREDLSLWRNIASRRAEILASGETPPEAPESLTAEVDVFSRLSTENLR